MPGLVPFNRRRRDLMSTGFDDFQNMLDDFFFRKLANGKKSRRGHLQNRRKGR